MAKVWSVALEFRHADACGIWCTCQGESQMMSSGDLLKPIMCKTTRYVRVMVTFRWQCYVIVAQLQFT